MMKRIIPLITGLVVAVFPVFAQNDLTVYPEDILLESTGEGFSGSAGYHLYIKKKNGMESVLLTETTKDPDGKEDNYAYRALTWNAVNGDEVRYLNGKPLVSNYAKYSLVDSTIENHPGIGECFHIYIPQQIQFGYPWTRNGILSVKKGTFINIRAFAKKYADYTGDFKDNPFMFDLGKIREQEPPAEKPAEPITEPPVKDVPVLTDDYNPLAAAKFSEIAENLTYSKGPPTIVDDICKVMDTINPKNKVDVVFAIDATGSMKDDIDELREKWVPRLLSELRGFGEVRLGLLLYRDYVDRWRYKKLPVKFFDFTENTDEFLKNLNGFSINGLEGGDIPEAVYEALYASEEFYNWDTAAQRQIILIGDAEPHPHPRGTGKYTKKLIEQIAQQKGIKIDAIITPDDKAARGR
ncbi:MAG: VWA domain-containing protein [Treponema sp.]|jgi:hypothetical protein|nr:VWA domain-containing protein [Treponema sp.]